MLTFDRQDTMLINRGRVPFILEFKQKVYVVLIFAPSSGDFFRPGWMSLTSRRLYRRPHTFLIQNEFVYCDNLITGYRTQQMWCNTSKNHSKRGRVWVLATDEQLERENWPRKRSLLKRLADFFSSIFVCLTVLIFDNTVVQLKSYLLPLNLSVTNNNVAGGAGSKP